MSAKKRTSLDAVFGAEELPASGPARKRKPHAEEDAQVTEKTEIMPEEQGGGSKRPNVKQHTAYLPLSVHEQLRRLAFEENRKIHDYIIEGLDRVFADRGLPAIKDAS